MGERVTTGRRTIVIAASLGGLALALLAGLARGRRDGRDDAQIGERWARQRQRQWQVLGRSYLRLTPAEANVPRLAALLFGDGTGGAGDRDERLLTQIRARVREDFAQGRTVSVEGWLLAVTEARLAAVVSLEGEAPTSR